MAKDLFGEIPVTWPEIWNWVETVAGIPRDSWRARYYAEHWDVAGKIRRQKQREHAGSPKNQAIPPPLP